jgi:hypothetical protein
MGDVYRMAERVVWLGPDDETSSFAIDTLKTLGSRIHINWETIEMTPTSQEDSDWADIAVVLPYDKDTCWIEGTKYGQGSTLRSPSGLETAHW